VPQARTPPQGKGEPSKRTSEQLYNTLRDARDQVQVAFNTAINQVAGALGSSLQGRESGPASHRSGQVQASRVRFDGQGLPQAEGVALAEARGGPGCARSAVYC
jgi:hypothetical protein